MFVENVRCRGTQHEACHGKEREYRQDRLKWIARTTTDPQESPQNKRQRKVEVLLYGERPGVSGNLSGPAQIILRECQCRQQRLSQRPETYERPVGPRHKRE